MLIVKNRHGNFEDMNDTKKEVCLSQCLTVIVLEIEIPSVDGSRVTPYIVLGAMRLLEAWLTATLCSTIDRGLGLSPV